MAPNNKNLKNTESNKVATNSIYSLLPPILTTLLAIWVTPFLLHNLTPEIYGIWVLIASIVGPIALLEFGVSEATAKFVAASEEKRDLNQSNNIISSTMLFNIVISIAGMLLIFIIAYFLPFIGFKINPLHMVSAQGAFYLAGINFVLIRIIGVYEGTFKAIQDFRSLSLITSAGRILYSLAGVAAILLNLGLVGVVGFQTLSYLLILIIWIIKARKDASQFSFTPAFHKYEFIFTFKYGAWNTLGRLSSIAMQNVDKIILGVLLSTAMVGYFHTAFLIYISSFMIVAPFSYSLMPYFSVLDERKDNTLLQDRLEHSIWLLSSLVIMISIPFFVFSYEVLRYWISVDAANYMSTPLRFLILANWISSLNLGLGQFILGVNLVKYNAIWGWMRGIIATLLTIVLISIYGVAASGIGLFISQLTLIWLIYIVWKKRLEEMVSYLKFIKIFIQPLTCGAITVALLLIMKQVIQLNIPNLPVLVAVLLVTGLMTIFLFIVLNMLFKQD
ncbi:MAG: oligosaccharide flippase family protein, partial [Gammaproteobacteria bacterium]|nr:oligosaccharide flippase family protein [Gammaproteobacteria bacterium]